MMQIKDFEAKIQAEIDPELTIKTNPNADDIAGVYWKGVYLGVAVPPVEIKEEYSPKYCDSRNYPYRNIQMAEEIIKGKLTKFQDPEVFAVMSAKI